MILHLRLSLVAACAIAASVTAQTISAPFDTDYSYVDLGSITGVPTNLGGLTFLDNNTLLIGGAANTANGAIYSVPVTRDAQGFITGFGTATLYATCPNIDGGLTFGPGGVLFSTGYNNNTLLQHLPGSTTPDLITSLATFGISGSVGTCIFVPAGFPGAGQFKMASYSGNTWHTVSLAVNAAGTYDVQSASPALALSGGPEGILYPPPGSPQLPDFSRVIISEYGIGQIAVYDIDSNGDPLPATRQTFMTGLSGAEGAVADPVTGDLMFSTFGSGNRVIRVTGFSACGFYQNYGQGCAGAAGVPTISGTGCPIPGAPITIDIAGGLPNTMAQLCLGSTTLNLPAFGCTVLMDPDSCVGVILDGNGFYSYSISIPNLPIFNGWHGYWQSGFFDSGSTSGVVLTNGLDMFVL